MSPSTFSDAKNHLVYKIMNARLSGFPFSHLVVENALPADIYRQAMGNKPDETKYTVLADTGRVSPNYSRARKVLFQTTCDTALSSDLQFWAGLIGAVNSDAVLLALLRRFMEDIVAYHESSVEHVLKTPFRRESFLMRDGPGYGLKPHSDAPHKVVSALLYLPPDDKWPQLGTSIYIPKDREFRDAKVGKYEFHEREKFDRVVTLPYVPNTLIAFPKTDRSFHGVEVFDRGDRDLLLFDIKLPTVETTK